MSPESLVVLALYFTRGAHGYAVREFVRARLLHDISATTVYSCLARLASQQLALPGQWESGTSGPAKRVYVLTGPGRFRARELIGTARLIVSAVEERSVVDG